MDLLLSKVLPLAVYPIGIVILLGLVAALLTYTSRRRAVRRLAFVAVALLWVASSPLFADWAMGTLESRYQSARIEQLPDAELAVLLGGTLGGSNIHTGDLDAKDAIDRVLHAARLYHAGKVPLILVSGGNLPWIDATVSEAAMIAGILAELGVPPEALILEGESRNTRENAVNSAALFRSNGWGHALLVTSAWHMPRAIAAFEAVGLDVTPAPTDFSGTIGPMTILDFLPDASALERTTDAVKEWVGTLYYSIRGWL